MMGEKNYNPFKMWGSYVGLVLAFFFTPIYRIGTFSTSNLDLFKEGVGELMRGWIQVSDHLLLLVVASFFVPLTGFLVGWGIHSLFRRFKE